MLIKLPSPLHHKMYQENKKITSASTKKSRIREEGGGVKIKHYNHALCLAQFVPS